ncbi:MAG: NERD domain-containing protein, partial [Romboutsia sp.]|nr:NERD domain-containing protein [Romboutsia sp.]
MLRLLNLSFKRNLLIVAITLMFIIDFNLILNSQGKLFNCVLIFLSLIPISILYKKTKILKSGIKGEKKAYSYLKLLEKKGYRIIRNAIIPKQNVGFREIDFILVGPIGIFAIEVKNISGVLKGNINDTFLYRVKQSKGKKIYTNQINNPIHQLNGQIITLDKYIKKHNIDCFTNGIVVFTNKNIELDISNNNHRFVTARNKHEAETTILLGMFSIFKSYVNSVLKDKEKKLLTVEEIDYIYQIIKQSKNYHLNLLKEDIVNKFTNIFNQYNKRNEISFKTIIQVMININKKLIITLNGVGELITNIAKITFIILFLSGIFVNANANDFFIGIIEISEGIFGLSFMYLIVYAISSLVLAVFSVILKGIANIFNIKVNDYNLKLNSNYNINKEYRSYTNHYDINKQIQDNYRIMEEDFYRMNMQDEIDRIHLQEDSNMFNSLNESLKSVTSFDEGGYLQGPGLSLSDNHVHIHNDM